MGELMKLSLQQQAVAAATAAVSSASSMPRGIRAPPPLTHMGGARGPQQQQHQPGNKPK